MICYLIRHGKDDDTLRGGWSHSGLTDEGILQVRNLASYINENKNELKIARLFSSDLPRAIQTAQPISALLNLEIEVMPEFRETNNGVLAGMPNNLADKKYPGLYWNTLGWERSISARRKPAYFL